MNSNIIIISVSVIIPCFRCASTIEYSVLSVVQQTMKPEELILVDDNSGDDTLIVLQYLREKYGSNWIKIISLPINGGASIARNIGWQDSTCDYVAFLDSDDAWHPKKIELQYSWMQLHKEVALSGHKCVMLAPGKKIPFAAVKSDFSVHYLTRRKLLVSNPFVTPSFMVNRNLQYRFDPSSRYAEDFLFLLQIGLSGHTIAMLEVELVYVFKEFGVSGVSGNMFKMRCGDIKNYWLLQKYKKINFVTMSLLILYSLTKYLGLLLMGPKLYEKLNILLNKSLRRI
jgi:glycosyltransferase involved in cell wall biosynthesis